MTYTELPELGIHNLRIMGITSSAESGTFISISDAGTLKVTENHSGQTVAEINPSGTGTKPQALKEMVVFEQRKVFAVCNSNG